MTWPDGGTSELCEKCLMTRWFDVGIFGATCISIWQDHEYSTPADWYKQAMEFQLKINHTGKCQCRLGEGKRGLRPGVIDGICVKCKLPK